MQVAGEQSRPKSRVADVPLVRVSAARACVCTVGPCCSVDGWTSGAADAAGVRPLAAAKAAVAALSRPTSCRPGGGGAVEGRFGYLRIVAEDAVRDIAFELEEPMACAVIAGEEWTEEWLLGGPSCCGLNVIEVFD